jgi:hypothetical protein
MAEEDESGYLFKDGKIIDFEKIILNNINYQWKTGALRVRTTSFEVDVDFIDCIKPTKEQLNTIRKLKTQNRRLFFEIVDKDNKILDCCDGYDKTIVEMEEQIEKFYNKD